MRCQPKAIFGTSSMDPENGNAYWTHLSWCQGMLSSYRAHCSGPACMQLANIIWPVMLGFPQLCSENHVSRVPLYKRGEQLERLQGVSLNNSKPM